MSEEVVIDAYKRLWSEAATIRRTSYRCGGPRKSRRAADYLGFDLLNGGLREVWSLADGLGLTPNSRVLEIGCGLGGPARFIAERYGCRVTGLDLTSRQLSIAQELTRGLEVEPHVQFVRGDARKLPFANRAFTHIYSNEAFVHVTDKPQSIREAFRVLEPRGVFCVQDPVHDPQLQITLLEDSLHPMSVEGYREAVLDAGFEELIITDRTRQSERAYELLSRLVGNGPIFPREVIRIFEHLHPGVLPPLWRFLTPGRLPYTLSHMWNRKRAALALLGSELRVNGVRRMCTQIVEGYRSGAIQFYLMCARKPRS